MNKLMTKHEREAMFSKGADIMRLHLGVPTGSPLAVGAGQTGKTLTVTVDTARATADTTDYKM